MRRRGVVASGAAGLESPRVDTANECVRVGERRIDLGPKAFLVLRRLMQEPNQIVTKRALLDAAWPGTHVTEGVLTLAINQLRAALGDDSRQPRFIETVHRRGYRWIGELAAAEVNPDPSLPAGTGLFVGREAALAQLAQAAARARDGARQMVLITGEPGIGKTAMIDQFLMGLGATGQFVSTAQPPNPGTPYLLARGLCVDGFGSSEAYMPLLEALERLCRESQDDEPVALLRRLAPTWLMQLPRLMQPGEHDELRRRLAGSNADRMVRELLAFLEELTVGRTLVLVLEDLHWSDHPTVGALAALSGRRERAHLLVIASYRPADAIAQQHPIAKLKHELTAKRQCLGIALGGLNADAVGEYFACRFPNHRLPRELAPQLQRETSGNPLFLQNALDDFVQRGWLAERGGAWECTVDLATLTGAVPDGTREMIGFRLRQISVLDRKLLEAASVIGASFATQALAATLERSPVDVEIACARLARAEQFLTEGQPTTWPDGRHGMQHSFRHALYQQVVYAHVTPSLRRLLHARAATCLEAGFAIELSHVASQLALQFEGAAKSAHAVQYRRLAAEQAMSRYAYLQAIEHLRAALADLANAPAGAERDGLELMSCASLLQPMFATMTTKSAELLEVVERIQSISSRGETTLELLVSLAMLTAHHSMCGDMRAARSVAEQMLARAEAVPWGGMMVVMARGPIGYCQVRQGEIEVGVENLAVATEMPAMGSAVPLDPGIASTIEAAFGNCLLGHASRGLDLFRSAQRRVEAAGHLPTLVHVFIGGIRVGIVLRDDELLDECAAGIESLPEQFQEQWGAWAEISRSFTEAKRSQSDSVDRILSGEERLLHAGTPFYRLLCATIATTALVASGRRREAEAHLSDALALVHHTGEAWCEAELHRLHGELLLSSLMQQRRGSRKWQALGADAEAALRRALEVARRQGANWWELRAAVSLTRLLRDSDRVAEARKLLGSVYGELNEDLALPDLRAARDLMRSM